MCVSFNVTCLSTILFLFISEILKLTQGLKHKRPPDPRDADTCFSGVEIFNSETIDILSQESTRGLAAAPLDHRSTAFNGEIGKLVSLCRNIPQQPSGQAHQESAVLPHSLHQICT